MENFKHCVSTVILDQPMNRETEEQGYHKLEKRFP